MAGQQIALPFLPPRSRRESPSKRGRANTAGEDIQQTLPTLDRQMPLPPPNFRTNAPALRATESYMFKGSKPLYTRHIIKNKPTKMMVRCGQEGCEVFKEKETNRVLSGTGNWKVHYKNHHPSIPTSEKDRIERLRQQQIEQNLSNGTESTAIMFN